MALANLVLDLTRVRSGPTCVRQLADWGADVIKIEAPGDTSDMGGPRTGRFSEPHRNKRSLTLNLKSDEGKNIYETGAKADVIVENFRPEVKHRLASIMTTLAKNKGLSCVHFWIWADGPLAADPV